MQRYHINTGDLLVRRKAIGLVDHVGVGIAPCSAFHNTPERGEHVSSIEEFADGEAVAVYRTGAHAPGVSARVQKAVRNPKGYGVDRNCEDSAYEVLDGQARSPQRQFVVKVIVGAALTVGVVLLLRKIFRTR